MRYGGNYKSHGPQYVRGIQEGNGIPEDGDLWLSYSVNKEDMWVSRIQVPVQLEATAHAKMISVKPKIGRPYGLEPLFSSLGPRKPWGEMA